MAIDAKVQERGQLTLPKQIRDEAKVGHGDIVSAEVNEHGQIVLTPRRHLTIHDLRRMFPITEPIGDFEESMRRAEQRLAEEFR